MELTPRVRIVLAIAAVVVVLIGLVGVLAVAGGGDGENDTDLSASRSSTTAGGAAGDDAPSDASTSGSGAGGDGSGGGSSQPEASSGSTATGGQPSADAPSGEATKADPGLGEPADPGPMVAPKPGMYRYRFSGQGETREVPSKVEDLGGSSGDARRAISGESDQGQQREELAYRSDRVLVLKTTFSSAMGSFDCDWEPDYVQFQLPLRAGATWTAESSCTVTFQAQSIVLKRTSTSKVLELRRVAVGGATVDTWAIDRTEHFDLGGFGEGNGAGTILVSPRHGLVVRESGTGSGSGMGQSRQGSFERELLSLDPA